MPASFISEDQWALIAGILSSNPSNRNPSRRSRGRPAASDRLALEGILYVILNRCSWDKMPSTYPHFTVCHRRYISWVKNGAWEDIFVTLIDDLHTRTGINLFRDFPPPPTKPSVDGRIPVLHIPAGVKRTRADRTVVGLFLCNLISAAEDDTRRHVIA